MIRLFSLFCDEKYFSKVKRALRHPAAPFSMSCYVLDKERVPSGKASSKK
jgi:hypothetical protein